MGGKKSFIHRANKKTTRNWDAGKLDKLQKALTLYSIGSIREKTITHDLFSTPNKLRVPDLLIGNMIIIEHDTIKIHGELGYENDRTVRRNGDYMITGKPFAVINEDLAYQLGLDEGMLAIYLYFHEVMKINALKEAGSRVGQ